MNERELAIAEAQRRGLLPSKADAEAELKRRGIDLQAGTTPESTRPVRTDIGGEPGMYPLYDPQQPTGEISTITGKPIMEPSPVRPHQQAGFGTMVETGIVDDPGTQMNILSKRLGIDRERFGVVEGQIVYRGDDNVLYPAQPGGFKQFGAEMVAHSPEIALGTLGAPAGPVGAALGAIGGAGMRKGAGSLLYDEPQKVWGEGKLPDLDSNIGRLTVAGGTAFVGDKYLGGGMVRGVDRTKGAQGIRLIKAAGRGREQIELPKVQEIDMLAKKYGIDLIPPQTTKRPELIEEFKRLSGMPETADAAGQVLDKQKSQIYDAVAQFLDSFAPATTTPGTAGRKAVSAAEKAMEAPAKAAQKASKDFYRQAKQIRGVDIADTMKTVDGLIDQAPRGSAERKSLEKIKGMITRETEDATGKAIKVPEDRVLVLDKVKKEINAMWKQKPYDAPTAEAQVSINKVLDDMLTSIDDQVPVYAQARKTYQDTMKAMGADELTATKIAELTRLSGDKAEDAARKLFSPTQSSPDIVKETKRLMLKHGEKSGWDELLRVHLQNSFDSVKETATGNIGAALRKKVFGDKQQQKILKAAMTKQQYRNYEDFMTVLDHAGVIFGGIGSPTATRQEGLRRARRAAGLPLISTAIEFAKQPTSVPFLRRTAEGLEEFLFRGHNERMMKAMSSPEAAKQLQAMLRLKPESQKLIRQLGTFLAVSGAVPAKRGLERSATPETPPPTIRGR